MSPLRPFTRLTYYKEFNNRQYKILPSLNNTEIVTRNTINIIYKAFTLETRRSKNDYVKPLGRWGSIYHKNYDKISDYANQDNCYSNIYRIKPISEINNESYSNWHQNTKNKSKESRISAIKRFFNKTRE